MFTGRRTDNGTNEHENKVGRGGGVTDRRTDRATDKYEEINGVRGGVVCMCLWGGGGGGDVVPLSIGCAVEQDTARTSQFLTVLASPVHGHPAP